MVAITGKDSKGVHHLYRMLPIIAVRVEDLPEQEGVRALMHF